MYIPLGSFTVLLACFGGSYGLSSSQIPPDTPLSSLITSAKSHLANGSPREALLFFNAAVDRDPTNYITLFQRGAAYLSLGKNSQATEDFDRVLKLKPDFENALLQRSRLRARSADWDGAMSDLEKMGKRSSPEYQELEEARNAASQAQTAEARNDWETCVSQAGQAIMKASSSFPLRQTRAHCRLERGEIEEGISDLVHVLQLSPGSIEPHLQISSMLFYSLGDSERGLAQIRKCLHSDPDSKSCNSLYKRERQVSKQLEKVQAFLLEKKFTNAQGLLVGSAEETGLIDNIKEDIQQARASSYIHPAAPNNLYVSIIEMACEAYHESGMLKKGRPYCLESIELKPHSLHGLLFQAQVAVDEDRFEDAIRTLNDAKEHHPGSAKVQTLLQKAHTLLKRSQQKDYYKVLGVSRDADERTIKRAYRQLTKIHHPDKAISQGVTKEEAEKKMAAINEAYEVLSDPELKQRYDNGDDPNDSSSQRANPFQGSPFGHGGGQQFFFQQGGGGQQFKFSSNGFNFPGGFPFR
ncbi:hypothetical protein ASPZODRAFT_123469 [Penicilliopsis zonata CBS 506.65]|uniref:Tetratricopeptide repeat and J domain-containing co-chaperone DNJ1 n=1 Tax=Penicilliopsis zonata CBS 506.65 TaxID=1073090 RepID=A0A1L9S849_9EURO|nr:hypothetical protein ASPZODRAFT_123469 [Penicilliopsis zonata CBS 506.65]OJJ43335.1 hypothetical protein ASPZODRAFT_123469 [Penicilliopsis zonata CBS 506.65]